MAPFLGAEEVTWPPPFTDGFEPVDSPPVVVVGATLLAAAEAGRLFVPVSERPPPAPMPACPAVTTSSSAGDGCFKGIPTARLVDRAKLAGRQDGRDGCWPASRVL